MAQTTRATSAQQRCDNRERRRRADLERRRKTCVVYDRNATKATYLTSVEYDSEAPACRFATLEGQAAARRASAASGCRPTSRHPGGIGHLAIASCAGLHRLVELARRGVGSGQRVEHRGVPAAGQADRARSARWTASPGLRTGAVRCGRAHPGQSGQRRDTSPDCTASARSNCAAASAGFPCSVSSRPRLLCASAFSGLQLDRPAIVRGGLDRAVPNVQHRAEVVVRLRVCRIEANGVLEFGGGFAVLPLHAKARGRGCSASAPNPGSAAAIRGTRATASLGAPVLEIQHRRRHRGAADSADRPASPSCRRRDPRRASSALMSSLSVARSSALRGTTCSQRSPISSVVFCPQTIRCGGWNGLRGLAAELS